jgi:hypothetical protein
MQASRRRFVKRNSMAQALSQAAGHAFSRPQLSETTIADAPREQVTQGPRLLQAVAPSRAGKKPITGFFDPEVSKQIKKAALDKDRTMQELLQEALNDLFRKYDLPPIA